MGTSYHAGLAIGVELTEDHLFGEVLRQVNVGCAHLWGEEVKVKFCPECGRQVEWKEVHVLKPPFNEVAGMNQWTHSAGQFWAENDGRGFAGLEVIKVDRAWDEPDTFILGEKLSELGLSYGDKKRSESFNMDALTVKRKEAMEKLKAAGIEGEVRLWVYGYGC